MKRHVFVALMLFSASPAESHEPRVLAEELAEDEAVAKALQGNLQLRAARKQQAIAQAGVVSATALSNPSVKLELLHAQASSQQMGWGTALTWKPPQPFEWVALRSQARANVDAVRYGIAEQEWLLASLVRITHSTLLELREQERLSEAGLTLRQRLVALVRKQSELGRATRVELNLAELAVLYAQRDLDELELRRTQAQAQLHTQLGVVSAEPIGVKGSVAAELGSAELPDPAALAERALAARPGLKSARARITQQEQAVRVEKARRWPWLELGGRYRHNNSPRFPQDVLLTVELSLPVLNTNAGPLQVAQAQRDEAQAAADAQALALQQNIYAAYAELAMRTKVLRRYGREVLPVLTEHERLLETSLHGAAVDLVALLGSEESVLRGRREHNEARLAYRRAWLTLQAAVGIPLQEVHK